MLLVQGVWSLVLEFQYLGVVGPGQAISQVAKSYKNCQEQGQEAGGRGHGWLAARLWGRGQGAASLY